MGAQVVAERGDRGVSICTSEVLEELEEVLADDGPVLDVPVGDAIVVRDGYDGSSELAEGLALLDLEIVVPPAPIQALIRRSGEICLVQVQ